jgi:hypothetical protein
MPRRPRPPAGIPEVDPIPPLSSDRPSLKDQQQAVRREEPLIRPEPPPAPREDKTAPKVRKLSPRRVDRPFAKEIEPFSRIDEPRPPRDEHPRAKDREPPKKGAASAPAAASPAPQPDRPKPPHREPPLRAVEPSAPAEVRVEAPHRDPPKKGAAAAPAAAAPAPQPERPAPPHREPPLRAVEPSKPAELRVETPHRDPPARATEQPAPYFDRVAAQERQPSIRAVDPSPAAAERVQARDPEPALGTAEEPAVPRPAPQDRERATRPESRSPRWDDLTDPRGRETAFRAEPASVRMRAWDPEPTIRLDDYWAARDERPGARDRDTESIPLWAWLVLLAFIGAAAYIGYDYWQQHRGEPPVQSPPPGSAATPAPAPPGLATAEPAIRHPVPESTAPEKLPALDQSDGEMRALLTDLVGAKSFQAMVNPQQLVRRIVATVDNLPRKTAPVQIRPIKPAPGQYVPSPANTRRYAGHVRAVESLDARALVQGYVAFYPLFQRAYAELGFPDRYFNDRVVEAIDDMLAAPDLTRPTELIQPKVFYQYADPRLEARSAGQKFMMRLGPENAAKVKAKLREIRQELAKPMTGG